MKKDILLLISLYLFLLALLIFGYWHITENVSDCTSDPIKFGVEKIRTIYDAEVVFGSITIMTKDQSQSWEFGDKYFNFSE